MLIGLLRVNERDNLDKLWMALVLLKSVMTKAHRFEA